MKVLIKVICYNQQQATYPTIIFLPVSHSCKEINIVYSSSTLLITLCSVVEKDLALRLKWKAIDISNLMESWSLNQMTIKFFKATQIK